MISLASRHIITALFIEALAKHLAGDPGADESLGYALDILQFRAIAKSLAVWN